MNTDAEYYLAQMTPDLLRRTPVNIGVVVSKRGTIAVQFQGEQSPGGDIQIEAIGHILHPEVYIQWVE